MSAWKLYGACREIMDMMRAENGLDRAMEQRFSELAKALRLDDMDIRIEGTPQKTQRGDLLELKAGGRYKIRSLRPFGKELSVHIGFRLHGLAHTYIRSGG
jgi:lysyl-tRNA synthetase class II